MERVITCYYCGYVFVEEEQTPGECPDCKEGYNWYTYYPNESSDFWSILTWNSMEQKRTLCELNDHEVLEKIKQHREAINTPERARAYLVKLGTHNPDGTLTPEYGGWDKNT